ncbi:MAG: indolepyruvate oxidoreductase, partial [Candidatus Rokubacteria bacterium]|nr:indolepyruvate oxidoreductase [Candidatus Rokubacteria bacterium]
MADDLQLKSIFLSAVGGQGGNLLAEWIFQAATVEGHRAQAVSLPGLSQRGGATSFYLELAVGGDRERLSQVVFSQHPVPGEVDVI